MAAHSPASSKNALCQESLFSTPLSFSQRLAAEQIKSSPLRIELLKERFLEHIDTASSTCVKGSEEGSSVDSECSSTGDGLSALQAEFAQRNLLRDDILANVKLSRERTRQYLTHVEKITGNDSSIHQQMAMLRRAHAEELGDKQQLIAQMTAIIRELEQQNERLRGLRRGKTSDSSPATPGGTLSPVATTPTAVSRSNVKGLVEQIERLQSEKAILYDEIMSLRSTAAKNWQAEFDMLRGLNAELEKDKRRVEEELNRAQLSSSSDAGLSEKRIHQLEELVEKLESELKGKNHVSQPTDDRSVKDTDMCCKESCQTCKVLMTDKQLLKQEIDDLRVQLVAAKAKSPEVVTKIRHLGELNLNGQEELERLKCQVLQARNELEQVCQELMNVTNERDNSKAQIELLNNQVRNLEMQLSASNRLIASQNEQQNLKWSLAGNVKQTAKMLASQLIEVKNEFCCLKEATIESFRMTAKDISGQLKGVDSQCQELRTKYKRELELRKRYHNELVELKGNIRVLCRVRPVIPEDGNMAKSVVSFDREDDSLVYIERNKQKLAFECNHVFSMQSSQEEVFAEVQQLVTSCVDGYNVCIFAYGQTGSGKTYTMEGTSDKVGINKRTLVSLFDEISERQPEWQYELKVSALEIYNESIRDLLGDGSSGEETLDIKMAQDGSVYVPGLTWRRVDTSEDISKILSLASKRRVTAATSMNDRSSRSHTVTGITVTGTNSTNTRIIGRLNLVDLAGSERVSKSGAEGDRLKEAQHINRSLLSLGDVIHALQMRQSHIPYRNSRLTYLLQDCLGGESKTLMLMNISPVEKNAPESCATLSFAQRVMSVELGPAKKRTLTASIENNGESKTPLKGGPTPSKVPRKK